MIGALLALLAAWAPAVAVGAGPPSPAAMTPAAAGAAHDEIDDPKVARRLKRRVTLPAPVSAPVPVAAPPALALAAPAVPLSNGSDTTITRESAPPVAVAAPAQRNTPRVKIGYRRFSFVRPGTTNPGSTGGAAGDQPFNSLSLDLYPLSWFVRLGLSTQYGWESGRFGGSGDYFIAQSFSLGGQLPGKTFTPFLEALGGGGYMRRLQFERTIPTAYWQLGLDAGVEIFLHRYAFVSLALGYLHPVNGFARETSFASVYVDTWSFKLGFGL